MSLGLNEITWTINSGCSGTGIEKRFVDTAGKRVDELRRALTYVHLAVVVVELLSRVQLLRDPMDCSPPGSSVHGILQARVLEWIAISFSKGSSCPRDRTCASCVSCTGRQILYHCATWEAQGRMGEHQCFHLYGSTTSVLEYASCFIQ